MLFSQSVSFGWAKEFESNRVYGSNVSIAIDSKKNVYSVGLFTGTADMDPGTGVFNLTAASNADLFITKLDSLGNFIWAKQIAGNNETVPFAIDVDALDNIYFTGYFKGITDFDPNSGVYNLTSVSHDIFICKLNSAGNLLLAKSFPSNGSINYARSIVIDKDNNIYTSGWFGGNVDFDPGIGTYILTASYSDIFVSKLDSLGNFLWAKQMGGTDIDQAFSLTLDKSGNILTTGSFKGTADFDPGISSYTLTSVSSQDIFVSKLDPNGNFIWAKRFGGGGSFFDVGNSIAVDTTGNVFTTGLFFGTADFDPGTGVYNITSPGMSDVFISKLDSNGNFIWVKHMGNGGNVVGKSICTDKSGNVYTTGYYSNVVDFDPNAGVFNLNCSNLTSTTFISKLDPNGDFVFAKSFWNNNSNSMPYGSEIKLDLQENVYIGGYYKGIPDFDPNFGVYTLTSPNFENSYVVKLNACSLPNTPTITIPTGSLIFCAGNSATLTASGSGSINWYSVPSSDTPLYIGDTVITSQLPSSQYTYYAQAYTCDASSQMALVTITVNPSPNISSNSGSICSGSTFTITPTGASTLIISGGTSIVSPTATTVYTITGINSNGCSSITNSYVNVLPSPTITVNNGTICAGKSFTITPSGADYYTYSSGNAIVTPTSNSTYTINGTSWQGCQSVNTVISSVTVNPTPIVTAISSSSLLCIGNTATLTATGATNYLWNTNSVSSSINVSPILTTTYNVTGTNIFGCSSSYSLIQNVISCVGVNEITEPFYNIQIYPNPISDQIKIDIKADYENLKIELYNSLGQLILLNPLGKGSNIINVANLTYGVYYAKIKNLSKIIYTQKLIK